MIPARHALLRGVLGALLIGALLSLVLLARGAVERATQDELLAATMVAAGLVHETRDPGLLDEVLDGWTYSDEVAPLLDGPILETRDGQITGRTPVFDEDLWFAIGQLTIPGGPARTPLGPLLWVGLAAALVVLLRAGAIWLKRPDGTMAAAVLGGTVLLAGVMLAVWSDARLSERTDIRLDRASAAVTTLPDPERVAARPGGLAQLVGLPVIDRRPTGNDPVSTLSAQAVAELRAGTPDADGRLMAADVTYAVRDVAGYRIVALPYESTNAVAPMAAGVVLLTLLALWLIGSLAMLVEERRTFMKNVTAWSFLAPGLVHLGIFTFGPLLFAAWLSLHRWSLLDRARPFVGLENYGDVLSDGSWWSAVANTALFSLHVPISMVVALGLALLVRRSSGVVVALRAIFFLPTITSLVALAIVWQWMFHAEYGLLNAILGVVGIGPVPWLDSPTTALPALMLMSVWMVVGYQMVLFQAGLAAIPESLYDAARIDGAGAWSRFRHVTLPGLRHTLFFVLVTSVIGSFQVFGAVYVMTEGGPLGATDVAVYHIYEEAWEFFRFGRAAAMSWILFAVIFGLTWLQFRGLDRDGEPA